MSTRFKQAQVGLALVILVIVALVALAGLVFIFKGTVTGRGYDAAMFIDAPYEWDRNLLEQSTVEQAETSTNAWQIQQGRYRPTGFQPYSPDLPSFPSTMDTSGKTYPKK